jgi:N-acyl-D-aspartate/D-glutamate deacylase
MFVSRSENVPEVEQRSIRELMDESGRGALDVMADIVLSDDLQTRFAFQVCDFDRDVWGNSSVARRCWWVCPMRGRT